MDCIVRAKPILSQSRSSSRSAVFACTLVLFIAAGLLLAALNVGSSGMCTGFIHSNILGLYTLLRRIKTHLGVTLDTTRLSDNTPAGTPCRGPVCLDVSIGARLLQEEIQHLRNILDLVDGFGRPLGQVFDFHRKLVWAINPHEGVIPDMSRLEFKQNVINFLKQNRAVDKTLLLTGLEILGSFHSQFLGVGPGSQLLRALNLLKATHSLRTDDIGIKAFQSNPRRYTQEVDDFVTATLKNFTGKVLKDLEDARPDFEAGSSEAETARTLAMSLLVELDGEKARVTRTLRDLPWWDRFTLAHFFSQSRTSYFREYSKFFDDHEAMIRLYMDWVQIVADNLLMLKDYADWYRIRQSTPIDARHVSILLSSEDEIQKLREMIDDYIVLAETRYNDYRAATTPPHRFIREGIPFTLPPS